MLDAKRKRDIYACKTCESNIEDDKISAYKQILNVSNAMLNHENVELPDQYKSKYVFTSITMEGIPNLIDSLCAVKYLVYENSLTTLDELAYHLKHDFPDEKYRQLLINKPPKYGNNIPEVNQLSEQIFGFVCSCIQKYNTANLSLRPKLISFAAVSSHDDMRPSIRNCNATPDGRHKGEIIASGLTPVLGSDFNGLTALLKSFAALPTIDATGGTSATVILDPYLLNDINLNRIADIFLSVAPNGLSCIRIEVTDTDTIKSSAFGQYENTISSDNTKTHTII